MAKFRIIKAINVRLGEFHFSWHSSLSLEKDLKPMALETYYFNQEMCQKGQLMDFCLAIFTTKLLGS